MPHRRRLAVALLALGTLATTAARAEERIPAVTVAGSGRVTAAPDRAHVTAGVVSEAPRAADAVRQTNAAMQKVIAALDAAGIERKHVQTVRFDVSPVYSNEAMHSGGPPKITGYRAGNQVQVEVRGVERVGDVLDALVAAGANEIGGVSFGIAEPAALEDEARKKAVADARRKAELYAQATGATLGRVLAIDEGGGAPIPVRYARMEAMDAAAPIAPGEIELGVTVSITWSLAP